ncbi:MAG: hypothetical protein R2874_09865 [Desulfobacterales bacterium]
MKRPRTWWSMYRLAACTPSAPGPDRTLATVSQAVKTVHDTITSSVYLTIRTVNPGRPETAGCRHRAGGQRSFPKAKKIPKNPGCDFPKAAGKRNPIPGTDSAGESTASHAFTGKPLIDQSEAILNGLYGDYLHKTKNPWI